MPVPQEMSEAKPVNMPSGDVYPPIYVPTRTVLWWLYSMNGGVTIDGAENIPAHGPAILAPNHVSHTDPPLIAITNQRRPVTIMAKEELFRIPVVGPYIRALGMFPVNRGSADRAALKVALDALANGRLLVIFPEGTRGDGVALQEPERGLGLMAMKSGAPVVPVYIHGTSQMLPRGGNKLRRAKVGTVYGKPVSFPRDYTGKGAGDALAADVMSAIALLRDNHNASTIH